MHSNLYVIQDVKANRTSDPFACPNDEVAKRNFLMGCFASDTPPQDCNLWKVGEYDTDDTDSSVFSLCQKIHLVTCTVEEIDGYSKIYLKMHGDEVEEL